VRRLSRAVAYCLSKIRVFVNARPWPVFPVITCVIVLPSAATETVIVAMLSTGLPLTVKAIASVYRSIALTITSRIDSTPRPLRGTVFRRVYRPDTNASCPEQ
jgi:hypothetical protein